jgi:hypothetical protein
MIITKRLYNRMWSRIWHNLLSQTSMLLFYVWDRQVRCGFNVSKSVETWVGGHSGVQDFCFHLLWGGVGAYPQRHVTELQPMWLAGPLAHTSVARFSLVVKFPNSPSSQLRQSLHKSRFSNPVLTSPFSHFPEIRI